MEINKTNRRVSSQYKSTHIDKETYELLAQLREETALPFQQLIKDAVFSTYDC